MTAQRGCDEGAECGYLAECPDCDCCRDHCQCEPEEPMHCECCGGTLLECSCEWETRFCVDRIEGGEAIGPGYEIEVCATHKASR